jgi:fructose-bisphosphate aldolase class II
MIAYDTCYLSLLSQPRECMRAGEVQTVKRLARSFADLKCQNICGLGKVEEAKNILGPRRGGLPV